MLQVVLYTRFCAGTWRLYKQLTGVAWLSTGVCVAPSRRQACLCWTLPHEWWAPPPSWCTSCQWEPSEHSPGCPSPLQSPKHQERFVLPLQSPRHQELFVSPLLSPWYQEQFVSSCTGHLDSKNSLCHHFSHPDVKNSLCHYMQVT